MGRIVFALAFALLAASMANAGLAAHYSPGTASLNLSNLPEGASATQDGNVMVAGHLGSYYVRFGQGQNGIYVLISGVGESQSALAYELGWLQNSGILETACESSGLLALSGANEAICGQSLEWAACDEASLCKPMLKNQISVESPSASSPMMQTSKAFGISPMPEGAGISGATAEATVAPQAEMTVSAGAQALRQDAQPDLAPAPQQPSVNAQQVLPLIAAFLAVIIISFLILQQRQETVQIGPQEMRLLENQTRAGIMSQLGEADRIPTDLSSRLGKSKATIVEHLETLVAAGFVEKLATPGKKFVFYRLTHKGKIMLLRRAG